MQSPMARSFREEGEPCLAVAFAPVKIQNPISHLGWVARVHSLVAFAARRRHSVRQLFQDGEFPAHKLFPRQQAE
jgi:hypothetical protein